MARFIGGRKRKGRKVQRKTRKKRKIKKRKTGYDVRKTGFLNYSTNRIIPTRQLFDKNGNLKRKYANYIPKFTTKQVNKLYQNYGDTFVKEKIFVNPNIKKKILTKYAMDEEINRIVNARDLIKKKDFKNRIYHQNEMLDVTESRNLYNSVVNEYIDDLKAFEDGDVDEVKFDLTKMNLKQIIDLIVKEYKFTTKNDKGRPVLKVGDIYRTLSEAGINGFDRNFSMTSTTYDNDYQKAVLNGRMVRYVTLMLKGTDEGETFDFVKEARDQEQDFFIGKTKPRKKVKGQFFQYAEGGFFPYYNMTELDLKPLSIYKKDDEDHKPGEMVEIDGKMQYKTYPIYSNSCLYKALEHLGLDENKLEDLKYMIGTRDIPTNRLKTICERLEISISVKKIHNTLRKDNEHIMILKTIYGDKEKPLYELGLIEGHYFPIIDTPYTTFYIKHYEELKNEIEGHRIYAFDNQNGKKYFRRLNPSSNGNNSFEIVKQLIINKDSVLETMYMNDYLLSTAFGNKVKEIKDLSYDEKVNTKEIVSKREKIKCQIHELEKQLQQFKFSKKRKKMKQQIEYLEKILINPSIKEYENINVATSCNKIQKKIEEVISKQPSRLWKFFYETDNEQNQNLIKEQIDIANDRCFQISKAKEIYEDKTKDYNERKAHYVKYCHLLQDYIDNNKDTIVFFDFETRTDKNNKHNPYLCCYVTNKDDEIKSFRGYDCGLQMIKSLPATNILMIAHNAYYDFSFLLKNLLSVRNNIFKGNSLISVSSLHIKRGRCYNLNIKDSCRMIPSKLSKFGGMFNLKQGKEVMPYKLVNKTNIEENPFVSIEKFKEGVMDEYDNEDKVKIALENVEKWDCINGNQIDLEKYSEKYCQIDCKVLKDGYNTFIKWMKEVTENCVDVGSQLTISGLAYNYIKEAGALNECYKISGKPREFIQRCVVGGRCMSSQNKKQYIKNKLICDFDAVQLYLSAIIRIGEKLGGFLKGKPKVIKDTSFKFLDTVDSYFVKIKVKNIRRKLNFPLFSYVNEKGVRMFSNDVIDKVLYVDKIALEDAMEHHELKNEDIEILEGYYFDEGRNPEILRIAKRIYEERKIKKDAGNSVHNCYKLIGNSIYGKMLLKEIETELHIVKKSKANYFIKKYYNSIKSFREVGDFVFVDKFKPLSEHFNLNFIGVEILSMSKRIMNEVMCLAEKNDIFIAYQDSDSMHIEHKDLQKLSTLFYDKYQRELCGNGIGQFNTDFELDGADNETLRATTTIILGKKAYIDKLEGFTSDGDNIQGYHYRMKGVTDHSIPYECELRNNKFNTIQELKNEKIRDMDELDLYDLLYFDVPVNFDLLCGGKYAKFEYKKEEDGFHVYSRNEFCRRICFAKEDNENFDDEWILI
jgi:hypothetical protein